MAAQDAPTGGMENGNTTKGQEPEVQPAVSSKQQTTVEPSPQASSSNPRVHDETSFNTNTSSAAPATPPISRQPSHKASSPVSNARPDLPTEPPVTRHTLVELDVNRIVLNSRLRHDINFDPELHFRPNMDGDKGRKKNQKADLFWQLLTEQLTLFMTDRDSFNKRWGNEKTWCLPALLKAVKEIIQTLVPSRDRASLDECFNLELLMQQFDHGVADLEKLASWLATLLKSHCAPMRDDWVDDMYNLLSKGNRTNDIKMLVKGLRDLLSVLEAMKLDVANHQIRCLRPSLIEDTVKFERRYFDKKMSADRLDITSAQAWFSNIQTCMPTLTTSLNESNMGHVKALGDVAIIGIGMAQLTLPALFLYRFPLSHNHHHHQALQNTSSGACSTIPPTFMHDEERIHKFREEIQEMLALSMAMAQFDELVREYPVNGPVPQYVVSDSMDVDDDETITSTGSAGSSPRASLIFNHNASPARPATSTNNRERMHQALVDLLRSTPTASNTRSIASRYQNVISPWATQIVRNTSAPLSKILEVEQKLRTIMSTPEHPKIIEAQMDIFRSLVSEVLPRLRDFRGMKAWHLFTNGTSGRPYRPSRGISSGPLKPEVANIGLIATKIAHVATLHHQVWAPVYAAAAPRPNVPREPSSSAYVTVGSSSPSQSSLSVSRATLPTSTNDIPASRKPVIPEPESPTQSTTGSANSEDQRMMG